MTSPAFTPSAGSLVRPLPDGPLDIVGDIHGEIGPLRELLWRLGCAGSAAGSRERQLVFVGDLIDRGPDSPAVVDCVQELVEAGRAQCVLGNHELNAVLGLRKHGNMWLFGEPEILDESGCVVPQQFASATQREKMLAFFRTLPLALVRPDLRVVHACWDLPSIQAAADARDVVEHYRASIAAIDTACQAGVLDPVNCEIDHQNRNPVKALTSGLEARTDSPFFAGGRIRHQERVRWWNDYRDQPLCVFGHYWRTEIPGLIKGENVFRDVPLYALLGAGTAMCIDYSVGGRWKERLSPEFDGRFRSHLAALRLPERTLLLEDGSVIPLDP